MSSPASPTRSTRSSRLTPDLRTQEVPIGLTHEVDTFAERVIRALFGPLFDSLQRNLLNRINDMDANLQAAIANLSSAVATEATEIKTNLEAVAQQIRDGLSTADAVDQINALATRVGGLSDVVTIDNATPAAPTEPTV